MTTRPPLPASPAPALASRGPSRVLVLAVALVATMILASPAAAAPAPSRLADDHTSFFADGPLAGSGWSACRAITWSVDVRGLPDDRRRAEVRRFAAAMDSWASAAGLDVDFTGRERLDYDARAYLLRPNGPPRERHVYVSFLTPRQAPLLAPPVVGLGNPSRVIAETREITAGVVVFRSGFVAAAGRREPDRVRHLYLHEIGHALGLGHAESTANIMHPAIGTRTSLGPGDRAGIRSLVQACPGTAQ